MMEAAKDALIGFAASSPTRPGQLPCPDTNNDGLAELPNSTGCPSGDIGRIPWRTLGLPDLRDGAAERLWYVASPVFTRALTDVCCFDNDTKGTLTVYQNSTATAITTEAVAVIFAPGPSIFGQIRDAANLNNPVQYLETTGGVNNALATGPFISAQGSSSFNDQLLVLTTANLIPVVEIRVAREIISRLRAYRNTSACNCYPWAANNFDDDSVNGRTQGMVPIENALPETWASLGITIPAWMIGNDEWGKKFYYGLSGDQSASHSGGTVTLNTVVKDFVLITTGPAGASRPSTNLADYIDDAGNRDGGTDYVTPSSTAYARDRIYSCPGTPGIC